ncbi:MAG: hypothetical protein A3A28_04820 [Candidatus Sungbacteria bacterium RIFCSPLOWO2_01_FULL_47_32]|uniref:MazG nucleotide pyrophosphohydrolase n=1 Tax=Candidatus Sungbacteria bacterium RIFCSPHIGHO2_01_FULL_47_32 TaxID=1802264 RepID=A0A1G2K9V5_9BACT|nr:MAG: hypothetical protein UX72_C0007G0011 [Parcubacteria group bacterium GW2011_GWA2_47_10]OGZ95321.1 MAG: hypothetical protein A2633_03010 [Candidatus Sungbacteria bacterium RIFCSPHIGHO2_01_FULL_47_32]OGZ99372.1 MAG: hypothetical protein A3D57_00750 [Candidatus Sungbacteria bacterium RIFCSPHIGHO2_02_FULL_46_12]OHA06358.1 MAG: hypothetical protein A3A28_04820 [Candidatus Sungbacteria bacterium RIFCSPLOWO2_01_FULL_47_32]
MSPRHAQERAFLAQIIMKSVVICGSQRYKDEIKAFAQKLRSLGIPVVFEPNFERQRTKMLAKEEKDRLKSKSYRVRVPAMVHEHFDRIRKADVAYFYNRNGYLGVNSTLELGFAHGKNMVIYALEPEREVAEGGEICRDILFTEIIVTPEELVKRLI